MNKYIIIILILMGFSLINLLLYPTFFKRQIIWYVLGFICIFIMQRIDIKKICKYILPLYIIFNVLLLYLLLFGNAINGSRAWINIMSFSFQPSEFMKIILIILLSVVALNNDKYILKCLLLTLVPSILTFLEPDTGNVIFYGIIFFSIIIFKEKSIKKFIPFLIIFLISIAIIFILYFYFQDIFIAIFGSSLFYRMDRITSLVDSSSYQLNQALIWAGSVSFFPRISITTIPEAINDFAFSLLISQDGIILSLIYILVNLYFNILIIKNIKRSVGVMRYITFSFLVMKILQESIHELMNIGLFPITGITLPFISYGGTSLLTYFIMIGLINNRSNCYSME